MLKANVTAMSPPTMSVLKRLWILPAREAVAALEFGILAPVMALMVVGVFDLAKIAVLQEEVWYAAQSVGLSASALALPVTPGGANVLTWQNADLALSATYAQIPWLAAGIATGKYTATGDLPGNSMVAVLSSVDYEPPATCASNCTFTPIVQFSKAFVHVGFNSASSVLRQCGTTLTQAPPGSPMNPETIDTQTVGSTLSGAGINVSDPFFVADVSLKYTPYFFNFITGPVTLASTFYAPVRTSNPGIANPSAPVNNAAQLIDAGDPQAGTGSVCMIASGVSG